MKIRGEEVAICFVSNMGYFKHFYAALASFVKNNPGGHNFFLFNEDINQKDFEKLRAWLQKKSSDSTIVDVKLDTSVLPQFKGYWKKLGVQVFHRLLIPDKLPKHFAYALYVDSDIIFCRPFQFNNNLIGTKTIAAIRDSISDILSPKRGLEKYFNAGIMLINIQRWKAKNALQKLLRHQPKKTLFAEQELLNEVFAGDWNELPFKYNYPFIKLKITLRGYVMQNNKKAVNVHFLGGLKPWKYWVPGSFLYWFYLVQTPFWLQLYAVPITAINSIKYKLLKLVN